MDLVFRALADPGRRALLDALFAGDGRTLGDLCAVLDGMTRFGVMKHLTVLEDAHLVTTRRVGRSKQHYLNPVPIREIHDRWISKYAQPWVSAMVDLRSALSVTSKALYLKLGANLLPYAEFQASLGDERARMLVYPSVWLLDGTPKPLMQMPAGTGTFQTVEEQLEILQLVQ